MNSLENQMPKALKIVIGINIFRFVYPILILLGLFFIYSIEWSDGSLFYEIKDGLELFYGNASGSEEIAYMLGSVVGSYLIPFLLIGLQIYFIKKQFYIATVIVSIIDVIFTFPKFIIPLLPIINLILILLPDSRNYLNRLNGEEGDTEILDDINFD